MERPLTVTVRIDPGKLEPEEVLAELVIGRKGSSGFVDPPECIPLRITGREANGVLTFSVSYTVQQNGAYAYGIRALPYHPHLAAKQETNLVSWG